MWILVIGLMVATALVLFIGLGVMIKGGKVNAQYANRLMTLRVLLQGATIAMLLLMFFIGGSK